MNGHNNTNTGYFALIKSGDTAYIDFSDSTAEALWFADSSGESWGNSVIDLVGFTEGTDQLRFGTTEAGLTADQLSKIRIDGAVADGLALDSDGFLLSENAPDPDPTTGSGSISSLMPQAGNVMSMMIHATEPTISTVQTADDLNGTWQSAFYSTNSSGPFETGALPGSNTTIYVQSTDTNGFFKVGAY